MFLKLNVILETAKKKKKDSRSYERIQKIQKIHESQQYTVIEIMIAVCSSLGSAQMNLRANVVLKTVDKFINYKNVICDRESVLFYSIVKTMQSIIPENIAQLLYQY